MNSLAYLTLTTFKNNLKELLHRPAKLIVILLFLGLLGMTMLTSMKTQLPELLRSREELHAIVLALYVCVFLLGVMKGFDSGASFYSMADVHFLFSTPIAPRRVLIYGLLKQIGMSLYVGFFLLFQYSWLHSLYGIRVAELAVILVGYGLCVFCGQLCAMAVYSFTSGNERAQRTIKIALIALSAAGAAAVILPAVQSADMLAGAVSGANSMLVSAVLFPVSGWLKCAVTAALEGTLLPAALFLLLTGALVAALLTYLSRARTEFYEDVLLATEVSFSAITAKKEGQLPESAPKHVKLGKTGIGRGEGAGAFYHKHMLEDRRSRFLLLDGTSMLFVVMIWGFAWMMRENGLLPVLFFSVYLQIFGIASGRWVRELLLPYIYLLPEPPFFKLLHICRENILKTAVEAVVVFAPLIVIIGISPLEAAACILMRIGFGLLFIAGNILIERLLGSLTSKAILLMLYFLILFLLCVPGIIIGVVASVLLGFSIVPALIAIALWNTACAALIVFLCRNMLDCAEVNNR